MLRAFSKLSILAVVALVAAGAARADTITFSGGGSDSDGSLSATVSFTALNGELEIVITNTQTGTIAQGQGVSSLTFSTADGLGTPTGIVSLSSETWTNNSGGTVWTLASGTATGTDTTGAGGNGSSIEGWVFCDTSGVSLSVAGGCASGKPQDLIFPSSGTAGPGNSLVTHCQPCLIGPTTIILSDPGVTTSTLLTSSNITDVDLGYGTGPDDFFIDSTSEVTSTPETSSLLSLATGLFALGLLWWMRKRSPLPQAS